MTCHFQNFLRKLFKLHVIIDQIRGHFFRIRCKLHKLQNLPNLVKLVKYAI